MLREPPDWRMLTVSLHSPASRGGLWTTKLGSQTQPKLLPLHGFPENATFHPLGTAYVPASGAHPGRLFVGTCPRCRPPCALLTDSFSQSR
jgi:hypothetical protein